MSRPRPLAVPAPQQEAAKLLRYALSLLERAAPANCSGIPMTRGLG